MVTYGSPLHRQSTKGPKAGIYRAGRGLGGRGWAAWVLSVDAIGTSPARGNVPYSRYPEALMYQLLKVSIMADGLAAERALLARKTADILRMCDIPLSQPCGAV